MESASEDSMPPLESAPVFLARAAPAAESRAQRVHGAQQLAVGFAAAHRRPFRRRRGRRRARRRVIHHRGGWESLLDGPRRKILLQPIPCSLIPHLPLLRCWPRPCRILHVLLRRVFLLPRLHLPGFLKADGRVSIRNPFSAISAKNVPNRGISLKNVALSDGTHSLPRPI